MSLVECYSDATAAAVACGDCILRHLNTAIAERGRATLAVSGGSSPKLMFQFFALARQDWSRVHVYWVDERCVPADDPRSNYKLAHEAWLAQVAVGSAHRVLTELGPQEAARHYDEELRAAGRFDVIHRGMGSDGHTASLFPARDNTPASYGRSLAAAVPGTPPRITMLPAVLEAARWTAVLATGADKAAMLDQVLHAPYDPVKYPAQIAALDPATATWFVDELAAHVGQASACDPASAGSGRQRT
jgi:6-phosphogluconolactonase